MQLYSPSYLFFLRLLHPHTEMVVTSAFSVDGDSEEADASELEFATNILHDATHDRKEAAWNIWPIASVSCVLWTFMMLEVHIFVPYLYSRVLCCGDVDHLSSRYDITASGNVDAIQLEAHALGFPDPVSRGEDGGRLILACSLPHFPRSSLLWSLSPGCPNKAFVQDSAQGIVAISKPLQKVTGLIVLPIGGAVADGVGRRPVLMAYALCCLLACLIALADTKLFAIWGDCPVYLISMLLCVTFQPKDNIIAAAIADVTGHCEANKAQAFSVVMAVNSAASLLVTAVMYFFLRMHLPCYLYPWLGFVGLSCVLLLFVVFLLPETLAPDMSRTLGAAMFNPVALYVRSMQLVLRDGVLVALAAAFFVFYLFFIGFFSTRVSYLLTLGFAMEETVLPELLAGVAQTIVATSFVSLLPRLGVYRAGILACFLFALGFFFFGPFAVYVGHSGPYIGNIFTCVALALFLPSLQTIISQRVNRDDQAKCQAAVSALGTAGAVIGVPLYNRCLFRATAVGVDRALPAFASMIVALLSAAFLTCAAARAGSDKKTSSSGTASDED